jgi:hypothetical protein
MHAGFALLEVAPSGTRIRSMLSSKSWSISNLDDGVLRHWLFAFLWRVVSRERRDDQRRPGLSPGQILLPRHVRGRRTAIISGGIAERAKFTPQCAATALMVGLAYPLIEGVVWNKKAVLGAPFKDFAGSIVVYAFGGWAALAAILQLGPRIGCYSRRAISPPPSSIPWLAMGSWLLCISWFGFNVMSAQNLKAVSGLVAMNSLMAICGAILAALVPGRNDLGFVHNGALAGLVAICMGSDVMHPIGARVKGAAAGARCFKSPPTSGGSTTCWAYGRCTG